MFGKLKHLYEQGRLTENGLQNAVEKGWISEEEKMLIIEGEK